MKFNGFGPVEDHVLPTKLLPIPLGIPDAGANSLAYNISSRSAIAPTMVNMAFPIGVEVSRAS